jgi:class 3 adenylate cyclase
VTGPEERKIATILFADLVGSTEMGSQQDPERTRALLDRFYDAMAAEIETAGGTIEKFAGDAVMAVFGAPASYEDHVERALHTALSIERQIRALFQGTLRLRIGVNTGEVVVGQAREGSSFVTGDAVNVAARLEQAAEPDEILVGERAVAASGGAFEYSEPLTVEAKGKPGGVQCRRLLRGLTLMRPRGVHGLRRAFVGRRQELGQLMAAYRRAVEQDRPKLVTILGDAGVGKSSLMRELWDLLADQDPEPICLTGRCLPYGRGITYWALGEILKEHFRLLETDTVDEVRNRLGDRAILGLALGLEPDENLHPLAARDRLHEAWIDFLESLVSDRPVAVLVEDLHWAEAPLLDLMEQLVREVRGPLLLVGSGRPDFIDTRSGWGGGRYDAETIWMEPLSAGQAAEMVESMLGAALPESARGLIVQRAEGNPLFIEEMVGSLIDEGVLKRTNGHWSLGELPADFHIPDTVQAVVAARMDLLEPAEKSALQAAAVIGRTFWSGPLYELADEGPDLRVIEDRDFIRRRSGSSLEGEREYAFKHAVTRDVAYSSVPKAKRAGLHAGFAEWIERNIGERNELASMLAHHYAAAIKPEDADLAWAGNASRLDQLRGKAIRWLGRAGELAIGRYEVDEGIALYRQALELEPDRTEALELWRAIGRASALRFDGQGLWDAMERAIELCDDQRLLGELYAELARETAVRRGAWSRVPDPDLVQGWIDRALQLAEPGSAARARALSAHFNWNHGGPAWAVEEADQLARRLGDPMLRIDALRGRWLQQYAAGRYRHSLEIVLEALALEPQITDPDARATLREDAVPIFVLCGRHRDARRLISESDDLSRTLFPHQRVHAVAMLLELEEFLAEWEAIRTLVPRTRAAVADNIDTPCVRNARSLLVGAAACAAAGDEVEASGLEAEAEDLGIQGYEVVLDTPKLRLALHRSDLSAVRRLVSRTMIERRQSWLYPAAVATYFDALVALADAEAVENDAPGFLEEESALRPFALRALGLVRGDRSLVNEAADRFAALGFDRQAETTRATA